MNYFAHALPFLDAPYVAAGTAVPDWLAVVDRKLRVRRRQAEAFSPMHAAADAASANATAVARGVVQHFRDDAQFHATRAFAETSLELTLAARRALGDDPGFRPSILGHLLVEVLLDAALAARHERQVEGYYRALAAIDPAAVQQAVNAMAPRPTDRLAPMIVAFRRERILCDYLDDARLLARLNQVMRRVKLAPLPDEFCELLPAARRLIDARGGELLAGIPA